MGEKGTLSLVTATRRLRPYFKSHILVIKIDYPIQKVLKKLDLVGRMSSWHVELSKFSIRYESRRMIKAQCLVNFSSELQGEHVLEEEWGTLYIDDSFSP